MSEHFLFACGEQILDNKDGDRVKLNSPKNTV